MALTKSQKVFKRAIMLRKKTGMSLKAAFKAAKKGGADVEEVKGGPSGMADALKAVSDKMPDMPSTGGMPTGEEEKKPEAPKGGRRRTRGRGKKMGARRTRRSYH
jgi:hypothetical protein